MTDKFYPIVVVPLSQDEGGGFLGFAPDLRGCMSDGETPEDALRNAQEAVREWIEEASVLGRNIPEPGSAQMKAKEGLTKLSQALKDQEEKIASLESGVDDVRKAIDRVERQMERQAEQQIWPAAGLLLSARTDPDDHVH
jgi:antitoxin HicB